MDRTERVQTEHNNVPHLLSLWIVLCELKNGGLQEEKGEINEYE